MTATSLARRQLSFAEAFVEIVARNISITPALGGKLWAATADINGDAA